MLFRSPLQGNILPLGGAGRIIAEMCYPPEVTKSQKLGGGAHASPPHKTLSGFAICIHYTHSEPAVNQLDEEFHGRLCGSVGAGDGEHGPHVVCQGTETRRALVGELGPPAMRLWRSRSVAFCWSRGFLMREERDRFENPASRRAVVSSLGAGLATWPLVPSPLMMAAEWAQALRISLAFLSM